jgi:hypothetical protein
MSMSRSRRKPYGYQTTSACPNYGKKRTSRDLRRKAKQACYKALNQYGHSVDSYDLDVYVDHPQDRIRGRAGSRAPDWGWDYFGDGRKYFGPPRITPRSHLDSVDQKDNWWAEYTMKRYGLTPRELDQKIADRYSRK